MAKSKCKCKATECEECPEWIFTFADLVMLMMGFFVILWVLKPAPGQKGGAEMEEDQIKFIAAVRDYFNFVPDSANPDKVDMHRLLKKLENMPPMKGPGDGGRTRLDKKGIEGTNPEVEMIRPSKQVGTGTRVLFAPGQAELTPDAMKALEEIAQIIKGHRNIFMIKGHASSDDFPEGAPEATKMDLSLRRAQAAADYLVSRTVARDTLRVQGCSTYEPVVMRAYTGDVRRLNRRVEVEATGTLVKELQDSVKPGSDKPRDGDTAPHGPPAGAAHEKSHADAAH